MGYADEFDEADILDSMSWMAMPEEHRWEKLAWLYIRKERDIRCAHRNYEGPTAGTVKVMVKSFYVPPRGRLKATVEGVLARINKIRKTQEERKENAPINWPEWKQSKLSFRRNRVAKRRYTVWEKDYHGKKSRRQPSCVAVGCISGVLMMLDSPGRYASTKARLYMRHKATGKVKVVVMDRDEVKSLTTAMTILAPKGALRDIFAGASIRLDFHQEAFEVDGVMVPWRNVCKVYNGAKAAHKTLAKPEKDK